MKIDWVPFPTLKAFLPKLFLDYIQDYDKVSSYFFLDYRKIEAMAMGAKEVARPMDPDVVQAIEAYARSLQAPEAVLRNISRLKQGASCVVTGQQPGLFGGPLYNLFKAVTAIQLAARIEAASGTPCVPLFWNHSDDHSLEEFCWASFPTKRGPRTLALKTGKGEMPAYQFDGSWTFPALLTKIQAYLELPEPILGLFRDSYQDNPAVSFSRLFTRIFGKQGLVVTEPRHLEGAATRAFCAKALAEHKEVRTRMERAEESLERAGYAPTLKGVLGTGLYLIQNGRRTKVEYIDGKLYAGGQELGAFAATDERRLSPQVFLRPLLQDSILPTCAYVGGPNEVVYLSELRGLYELFGVKMPAVFPRLSGTVIEPEVERVLAKMQFKLEDLFQDPARIQEEILKSLQGSLMSEVDGINARIKAIFDEIVPVILEVDKGLEAAVQKTTANITANVEGFKKRVMDTLKSKEEVVAARFNRVLGALRPTGELQERRYSMLYFLGALGEGLVDQLIQATDPFVFGHKIIYP